MPGMTVMVKHIIRVVTHSLSHSFRAEWQSSTVVNEQAFQWENEGSRATLLFISCWHHLGEQTLEPSIPSAGTWGCIACQSNCGQVAIPIGHEDRLRLALQLPTVLSRSLKLFAPVVYLWNGNNDLDWVFMSATWTMPDLITHLPLTVPIK